jgi:3-oxoacyl-[acyl-carrier protein] reductase
MFSLEGKRALITGASGGIGQSIAQALFAQGATVTLAGRNKDALDKLASTLGDKSRVHVVTGDLSSAEAADQLVGASEAAMGGIDILINNAGLTRDGLAMRMKDDDWQQVLDVNLTGSFRLTRAVLKGMMKQRYGRIINVASVVGVTGNPGQANYVASKAGLIGMGKAIAAEVASRGITVNAIAPGFIATAMTDALNDDQRSRILVGIPAGAMGTPNDIAAAAVFLASAESGYVTGQTIHVNGGMAMI